MGTMATMSRIEEGVTTRKATRVRSTSASVSAKVKLPRGASIPAAANAWVSASLACPRIS